MSAAANDPGAFSPPDFWRLFGLSIERADEQEIVLRMDVADALLSPFGTVHGGVLATLLDTGLAVAVARHVSAETRIATHTLNVSYVAFTRERALACRARTLTVRRSVAVAEGEVIELGGRLVAKAVATFGLRHPR